MPQAEAVVEGDVVSIAGTRQVAEQANRLGRFDAVIHNVGVGYREPRRIETVDGLPHVFAINVMAPYLLTSWMERPQRLVYLSSGMHHHVDAELDDALWRRRSWNASRAYAESKLYDVMLALAVSRRWPEVISTALEPGWVPTRMGGPGAPDDMDQAHRTQAWLATSDEAQARSSGGYFHHLEQCSANPQASRPELQAGFLTMCEKLSGVALPA